MLGRLIAWLRLGRRLERVRKAVDETPKGYDWSITLQKMIWDAARTTAGVAALAVLSYYSNPENLKALLNALPAPVAVALIPIVSGLIAGIQNWVKSRDK